MPMKLSNGVDVGIDWHTTDLTRWAEAYDDAITERPEYANDPEFRAAWDKTILELWSRTLKRTHK